jgi:hypothetical protein
MSTTERDLVEAVRTAVDPVPTYWGWAPFETAEVPPTLPLVTVTRLLFTAIDWLDMCEVDDLVGDTTVVAHVWAAGYEQARALQADVRVAILSARGWSPQSEQDSYEPTFRAWRIESQWLAAGVAPD